MRLIDTHTHLLLEPWKAAGKEYAILSHTWGDQEVIFQEWEQLYPSGAIKGQCPHVRHQGIDQKAGYHKVMQACEQARRDGIRYLWCDTICINKESSAELSEAINSMFKWYRDAKVCYVYLTDVIFHSKKTRNGLGPAHSNVPGWFPYAMERKQDDGIREMKSRFMASRWWTRGWTLQELLAPKNVVFFTQDWTLLGHKSDIAHWISALTGIHEGALEDPTTIRNFSIAQRMSWAAERQTTVVEDMAYCLLGIFDINMPMLYGQGEGAFQKLQHEIIKVSGDQSIFAWTVEWDDKNPWTGALAKSPRCFKNCGSIVCDPLSVHEPYSLTNVGFKIRVPMIRVAFESQSFVGLGCFMELHGEFSPEKSAKPTRRRIQVWIPVSRRGLGDSYERVHYPTSRIYLQSSYASSSNVVASTELFLVASAPSVDLGVASAMKSRDIASITGISVSLGYGCMSMISKAYKTVWHPGQLGIIPVGCREPYGVSHQVISSGHYCIILSVAWDDSCKPKRHIHTTFHHADKYNLSNLINQLKQENWLGRVPDDASDIHQRIRSSNHSAVIAAQNTEAPMIIVEDEPLYDMHQSAFIMVDIIFKERGKTSGER